MAKFCNKCGTPLVDGKCPNCESEVKEEKIKDSEDKKSVSTEENILTEYFEILKGMFTKPVQTIKKYATEKNLALGIGSIVICSILFGVLIHVLLSNIFSSVGLDLSVISSMIEMLNTQLATTGISLPVIGSTGVKMAIMFALASVIMAGLIYLMHVVIFKKKLDFKKIITMIGVIEVSFSAFLLVATIASFIHYVLGIIITIFAIGFFLVQFHQGILAIALTNRTQTIYTIALCVGIAIIAFILAFVTVAVCIIVALITGISQTLDSLVQSSWGSMGL